MRTLLLYLLLVSVLLVTACSDALVRVKPYERGYFAQEKMLFSPLPASAEFEEHIFAVRESSQGGSVSFQGGCGCR